MAWQIALNYRTQDEVTRTMVRVDALLSSAGLTAFLATAIGPYLQKRAKARFKGEGDDVVGSWHPLAAATQAIRGAGDWPVAPDHPINRRSGELEQWVTGSGWKTFPSPEGATLSFPDVSNLGTGELLRKVQTAQWGKDAPRTPARPVVAANEADLVFLVAAFGDALQEVIL